jgi:hypothetical protein
MKNKNKDEDEERLENELEQCEQEHNNTLKNNWPQFEDHLA